MIANKAVGDRSFKETYSKQRIEDIKERKNNKDKIRAEKIEEYLRLWNKYTRECTSLEKGTINTRDRYEKFYEAVTDDCIYSSDLDKMDLDENLPVEKDDKYYFNKIVEERFKKDDESDELNLQIANKNIEKLNNSDKFVIETTLSIGLAVSIIAAIIMTVVSGAIIMYLPAGLTVLIPVILSFIISIVMIVVTRIRQYKKRG